MPRAGVIGRVVGIAIATLTLAQPGPQRRGLREVASGTIAEDGGLDGLPADVKRFVEQAGWIDATAGGEPPMREMGSWHGNPIRSIRVAARDVPGALRLESRPNDVHACIRVDGRGGWMLEDATGAEVARGAITADGTLQDLPKLAFLGAGRAWRGVRFSVN